MAKRVFSISQQTAKKEQMAKSLIPVVLEEERVMQHRSSKYFP